VLSKILPLDGANWLISIDPENSGRRQRWYEAPAKGARPAQVPWVIQDPFPDYQGVAWYWREFDAPANPHPGGRYLLRFEAVDYLAEAWVNGAYLGIHEGGEEPFVLDATAAVVPGMANRLAVRVLSPTHEPVDGIALREVAVGRRDYPHPRDNAYSTGGIVGAVELLVVPAVRVEDLYVVSDWKTGDIRVQTNVRNAGPGSARIRLQVTAAPAAGGEPLATGVIEGDVAPGDTPVAVLLHVEHPRLWELNDPYLYRVTVRVQAAGGPSVDEHSVRCGFRDFRFEDGYFRLNGRRIRLHGALYIILHYPVTQSVPHDEDLLRRDILNMKGMGFNLVRIHCGAALPRQLDLLDEVGLLACEEHFGARALDESPLLEERWDRSITAVVRRDRNHPSIVIWSLLNEVPDGHLFRHAVDALKLIRSLDESRMVLLGSGRWDKDPSIGSFSNPGSQVWEGDLRDVHAYPGFPHSAEAIRRMRTNEEPGPLLLSEYGVCGAQDYPRFMRHFEQLGKEHAPDARLYRALLDQFLSDWQKWRLDECWAQPEDFFKESQCNQAQLALDDYNAWMSNPALVGSFTSTQINDAWFHGCGLTNYFRELKPGMADAYTDMAAKVRWCLFVDPVNVYRGSRVRLEAVLVNLDALTPGQYPARVQVVGPRMARLLDKTIIIEIPQPDGQTEPPFARTVFTEDLFVDSAGGRYRFLVTFQRGVAAGGGDVSFYVGDPVQMPAVSTEVVLWGEDPALAAWFARRGIRTRTSTEAGVGGREVILVSGRPPARGGAAVFTELTRRIAQGSGAVFLTPETLVEPGAADKDPIPLRWAPLPATGRPSLEHTPASYFRADYWAKEHPIFDGLPCGGIMDYIFYRDILPAAVGPWAYAKVLAGLQPPLEAVSGAIQTSGGQIDYRSDLLVSVHGLGAGRFILNALRIRENLDEVPAAEHLLRNMLNYVSQD
jgi:hypothetical protein